jgi:hypothetical protein
MRKRIFFAQLALFFAGVFLAGCATAPMARPQPSPEPKVLAEFDFSLADRLILLPVKFRGEEYRFALDTAANRTVFDLSLRDKLGWRLPIRKRAQAAQGTTVAVEAFLAPRAYVGPLSLEDCGHIAVLDLNPVSTAVGKKVHGIIGTDFLKEYAVQIDFDNSKVRFFESKTRLDILWFLRPETNEHPEWGEPLPIKFRFLEDLPFVRGRVPDNIAEDFLIDTADNTFGGTLQAKIFNRVCKDIEATTKTDMITTAAGKVPTRFKKATIVEKFSIGQFEYRGVGFYDGCESTLGLGFLSRHLVTFDFPNKRMYLKKGKTYERPPFILATLEILGFTIRPTPEAVVVESVEPNSPAEHKGIKTGDIILKVDDLNVTFDNLTRFAVLLNSLALEPDSYSVEITIKRGDDIKQVSFGKGDVVSEENGTD